MTEVPEDLTHRRVAVGEFWSVRGSVNSVGIPVIASRPTSDEAGRGVWPEGVMMHLEDLAKWRVEDLLHEARQARLLHQVPRQPWPLGAWLRKLALVRLAIDGAYADERLWPRLTRYPYGPPPQG